MSVYVYDIEVFSNFFSATFMHPETDQVHQFCVHAGQDQRSALAAFLRSCDMLIGFNSINYDAPMLHAFLKLTTVQKICVTTNECHRAI
jgi:hypothetical protein